MVLFDLRRGTTKSSGCSRHSEPLEYQKKSLFKQFVFAKNQLHVSRQLDPRGVQVPPVHQVGRPLTRTLASTPVHGGRSGVEYFAQGHFDMLTAGSEVEPQPLVRERSLVPPEPQPLSRPNASCAAANSFVSTEVTENQCRAAEAGLNV